MTCCPTSHGYKQPSQVWKASNLTSYPAPLPISSNLMVAARNEQSKAEKPGRCPGGAHLTGGGQEEDRSLSVRLGRIPLRRKTRAQQQREGARAGTGTGLPFRQGWWKRAKLDVQLREAASEAEQSEAQEQTPADTT